MRTHALATVAVPMLPRFHALAILAGEPASPWAARGLDELVPPDTLAEARAHRDELTRLLRREREAAADFLLALADFDRRRGWERLGHASLFAFLTKELGLSSGAAHLRLSAARLLPRHPAVEAALRTGQLCISSVGQLARVLTPENEAEVLPRFHGRSAREAAELVAELSPRPDQPRREVVTALARSVARRGSVSPGLAARAQGEFPVAAGGVSGGAPPGPASEPLAWPSAGPVRTNEAISLQTCEAISPRPEQAARTPVVEPLSADMRRLHLTVSKGFLEKVAAAKNGLSHAWPGASSEEVLEAALDLLLERQGRR